MTRERAGALPGVGPRDAIASDAAADHPVDIEAAVRPTFWQRYGPRLALLSPVAILLLWQLLSSAAILNPLFFPPPSEIVSANQTVLINQQSAGGDNAGHGEWPKAG